MVPERATDLIPSVDPGLSDPERFERQLHQLAKDAVAAYRARLNDMARRAGVQLGEPRFDDDWFAEKAALLVDESIPGLGVVSFTFGLPPDNVARALRAAGFELWMTVTSVDEALAAAGADALIVQGVEAGGHRGVFVDDDAQLIAVDFGIMGRLGAKERLFLAEILHGFITRDYRRTADGWSKEPLWP